MTLQIGVLGGRGRMGQLICAEIMSQDDLTLMGFALSPHDQTSREDLATLLNFPAERLGHVARNHAETQDLIASCDAVIDFTTPSALVHNLTMAEKASTPIVIGTTGITESDRQLIAKTAQSVPVLYAANMSLGIALLSKLVRQTATTLGEDFDIEILDFHHRHKKDAPSGTSLTLGNAAAEGRGVALQDVAVYDRSKTHEGRKPGTIGFSAMRGGNVAGDHRVYFAGPDEVIELSHVALDRRIFARGAVRAAQWLATQKPGLYTIQDMLKI